MNDELSEEEKTRNTHQQGRAAAGGRWGSAGMPTERAKDARGAVRRLLQMMGDERRMAALVVALGLFGVGIQVTGPRLLGRATDVVVQGVAAGTGVDYTELRNRLLLALSVYVIAALLIWAQAHVLAGVVQRSMHKLRNRVEDKL